MSLVERACPGCGPMGGPHYHGCRNDPEQSEAWKNLPSNDYHPTQDVCNESIQLPCVDGPQPGVDIPHFASGMTVREELKENILEQKIMPSTGTKLVCTSCGRQDWHTLLLRRKAGLLEGLCKQEDGSGCYPIATRRNCSYTYPNQIDCPQVAEYCLAIGKARLNPRQVCRDHVGEVLRHGPIYQVWPLED